MSVDTTSTSTIPAGSMARRPPPPMNEPVEEFKFDIEEYLNKSPITTKFRQENPNLQPTVSNDSAKDFDTGYSSLDPTVVTPPSPPISSNSTTDKEQSLYIHRHKHSVASFSSAAFTTSPLEPQVTQESVSEKGLKRRASKLDRIKRFSLTRLDLNGTKRFIPTHRKFNSVNLSMNRLSISSPQNLRTSASFGAREGMLSAKWDAPSLRSKSSSHSLTSNRSTIVDANDSKISTPYWKYHVLKFGKDLYLTTNPGLKHMYCRNGPGYYVEISKNGKDGFTMVFKDAETQADKSKPPIMTISKKPEKEGGYFTASLTRSTVMKKNIIKGCKPTAGDKKSTFNGLSLPQTIADKFIPYDRISNLKSLEHNEVNFKNYEIRDFNNRRWNIGSIPRVRISKLNKFKTKLNDTDTEQWKFIGKKNIYFHQNYVETDQPLPFKIDTPQDIYLQNPENNNFPPVLAMFRPYKPNFSTKMKNFNKKLSKKMESPDSPQFKSEKFDTSLIDNDMSGGELKNYFIAGDGLYYNKHPEDDVPDDNKLGWLTIYEDRLFQEKGMFDLVLGLSLAVGYETYPSKV